MKPDPMQEIADSIRYAARHLGKENAIGPDGSYPGPGAIELLAMNVKEAGDAIASSIEKLAAAIDRAGGADHG